MAVAIILLIALVGVGAYLCYLLMNVIKNQKETIAAIKNQTQSIILQDNSLQTVKQQLVSLEDSVLEISVKSINVKTKLKNYVFNTFKNGDIRMTMEDAANSMNVPLNKARRMIMVLVELKLVTVIGNDIEFRVKREQLAQALEKIDLFFYDEIR